MARPSKRCGLQRPVLLRSLTPFGDRVALETRRGFERDRREVPVRCQFLDANRELGSEEGPALTAALNMRNGDAAGSRVPLAILLCAAAELADTGPIERVVDVIRREFRRSHLAGEIALLIYTGPVNKRLPDDAILCALNDFAAVDVKLIYADSAANGGRLLEEDAVRVGGRFLFYLLTTERLQEMLFSGDRAAPAADRQFSFGVGRLDLAEGGLRRAVCRELRSLAYDVLFGANGSNNHAPKAPSHRIDVQGLTSLRLAAGGSLRAVDAAVTPAVNQAIDDWLAAKMRENAERTRRTLLELLPPPPASTPPGFWARLWAFLKRLFLFLFLWKRPLTTLNEPVLPPQPGHRSSRACAADLMDHERIRIQIQRKKLALQLALNERVELPTNPFEFVLSAIPELRNLAVKRCLPDAEEFSWQLARATLPADFVGDAADPADFLARVDALCDQVLKTEHRGLLLIPDDYQGIASDLAARVCALFPGSGSRPQRLARVPAALRETFDVGDYEPVSGDDDELVFLTLQGGITLRSLFDEGSMTHEALCSAAAD